jgi:hypothetical protein
MAKFLRVLLAIIGVTLMIYGTFIVVFDFFFPPAPPPRGWVPPKSTWDKVWDKIKATIEDKAKEFAES